MNFIAASLFILLLGSINFRAYCQNADDLVGRWEGVHYYGDTTRLYDGTLVVRASTIDSMRMVLTIERLTDGKFTGKLHEHFFSDPNGSYFNADVSGFISDEKIHFNSFTIRENKMPPGNRWCKPKATGILVKNEKFFVLQMFFESTLTCTIGPAIVERPVSDSSAKLQVKPPQANTQQKNTERQQGDSAGSILPRKPDSSFIIETFEKRNRIVQTTIHVRSDSIKINFVDNGIVDGDSISIFVNGQLRVAHVRLSAAVFSIHIQFEEGKDEVQVAMFAENLGSIPPNTALMQVVEGSKVHQAYLSSDTMSNAVIKIRRVR